MISFLLATNLFLTTPAYYPPTGQPEHLVTTQTEDTFKIGKFLENNWVILIAAVVFIIRLQNSVEDIKKDNQNKLELLAKDFAFIQLHLKELREQIDQTAGTAKSDVRIVSNRLAKTEKKLNKFIEFINSDRSLNSKPIFKIEYVDDNDDEI
jgi:hypothetical protein